MNNAPLSESEHLLLLHRHLSECMGGILPAALDIARVKRVLDVECGAGGWVYDLAWRYPSLYVVGTESRPHLAREAHALVSRAGNAEVIEQDIHSLSDQAVPPASFDLVHARFLVSKLTPMEYPAILESLTRRCRTGGMFVWEEPEYPLTNSPACEQFYRLIQDALQAAGRAFSPGPSLGITAQMSNWHKASGCHIMLDTAYALDISATMKGHAAFQQQLELMSKQLRPFLLRTEVTTEADFDKLYEQAQQEIAGVGFRGVVYVRTMVGTTERA
ncbi:MAG TPA: methyltransferase domain-containing protein [Ktedonobacteraceae bacterium]|nr:methyltransferase domain-containing protein [Ktedonobacteraceae bacterium]